MSTIPHPDPFAPLWSARYGQHYHDRTGAQAQARHVFLEASLTNTHPAPRVLEIGFGVGLNFLTTFGDSLARGVALEYLAFENDPLSAATLAEQTRVLPQSRHAAWQTLLSRWHGQTLAVELDTVSVSVRIEDASRADLPESWASAIYLDGFSPAVNPEVWTPAVLARLARALMPGGVLTTYSAAGRVRRGLQAAGLTVERLAGHGHKREFLRATKPPGTLPSG